MNGMREQADRALAAFATFASLDPNMLARAELHAAGVPSTTIEALFPSSFDDLVPGLIEQLEKAELIELMGLSTSLDEVDEILYQRKDPYRIAGVRRHVPHADAYNSAHVKSAALFALGQHLSSRFEASGQPGTGYGLAMSVAKVIWCTHWFMAHRGELGLEYRNVADSLMLRFAEIAKLAAGEEDLARRSLIR